MLIVHPKCGFGRWKQSDEGDWVLWKQSPADAKWSYSTSQQSKPTHCGCGIPLTEMKDGTLEPARSGRLIYT